MPKKGEATGCLRAKNRYKQATQKNTPYVRLTALTGIPSHRFTAISGGDVVSRAEIDALACAWSISARDLIASIAGRSEIVD